jgi:hypothetical protein
LAELRVVVNECVAALAEQSLALYVDLVLGSTGPGARRR